MAYQPLKSLSARSNGRNSATLRSCGSPRRTDRIPRREWHLDRIRSPSPTRMPTTVRPGSWREVRNLRAALRSVSEWYAFFRFPTPKQPLSRTLQSLLPVQCQLCDIKSDSVSRITSPFRTGSVLTSGLRRIGQLPIANRRSCYTRPWPTLLQQRRNSILRVMPCFLASLIPP